MTSWASAGDLRDIVDGLADLVDGQLEVIDGVWNLISAQNDRKTLLQTCRSRPEAASAVLR
ncbi:hypothetical protein [Novilysobacter erysipheiresistens]|uniref:Uncharacterized protein n=1 Tax=Novilysobacter erysipheiresistens TaxID=1749332 RepID=A0ABU7YZF7_9GAMM